MIEIHEIMKYTLDQTCYKCTNDREIVTCMIKKSEYCKVKLKYI